ncbi:hypothetical protein [Hoeflea sp.]|uniref:hypothetical protein n=1 Tax=Hoeflea sp. TaxID=1940281 RepID=UPI0037487BAD
MVKLREKQSHLWVRDKDDWYVEPEEVSLALFQHEEFVGPVWDPACGMGRIVEQAKNCGLKSIGSDIVPKNSYEARVHNFLEDDFDVFDFDNVVTNPPFSKAEEFVKKAISIVPDGGKVAAILPIVWLSGFSTKRDWLPVSPLRRVYPISPRPSMPPGAAILAGEKPGNGTKDFCWLVWEKGYKGKPEIEFLNTSIARAQLRTSSKGKTNASSFKW